MDDIGHVDEVIADCSHRIIATYGGDDIRLWACADCALRFYPACRTCVSIGHRNGHDAGDSLDAAWAEAEAALPEGCTLSLYWQLGAWQATYQHKHTECPACGGLHQCEPERETINWPATGPTPAAALRALAEKLREIK